MHAQVSHQVLGFFVGFVAVWSFGDHGQHLLVREVSLRVFEQPHGEPRFNCASVHTRTYIWMCAWSGSVTLFGPF